MEEKYYTPEISDIRVGYECELYQKFYNEDIITREEWGKLILIKNSVVYLLQTKEELQKLIRVPYLTKEQIEAEGWIEFCTEYKGDINLENMSYGFIKEESNYMLKWFFNDHQVSFLIKDPSKIIDYGSTPRYTGECKSINEFRTICKWLKI